MSFTHRLIRVKAINVNNHKMLLKSFLSIQNVTHYLRELLTIYYYIIYHIVSLKYLKLDSYKKYALLQTALWRRIYKFILHTSSILGAVQTIKSNIVYTVVLKLNINIHLFTSLRFHV